MAGGGGFASKGVRTHRKTPRPHPIKPLMVDREKPPNESFPSCYIQARGRPFGPTPALGGSAEPLGGQGNISPVGGSFRRGRGQRRWKSSRDGASRPRPLPVPYLKPTLVGVLSMLRRMEEHH